MGILEFHFHDCEFSPSMTVGDEADEAATESTADAESVEEPTAGLDIEPSSQRGGSGRGGLGALLVLVVLVALGAMVKWKRGGSSTDDEEDSERRDVDVSA